MTRNRVPKKGFVYLLVDTKKLIEGKFVAKFGCTKSDVKRRVYSAQVKTGSKFDVVLTKKSKDCFGDENKIKWGLKDSDGFLIYMGSEFIGIEPSDLDQVKLQFMEI